MFRLTKAISQRSTSTHSHLIKKTQKEIDPALKYYEGAKYGALSGFIVGEMVHNSPLFQSSYLPECVVLGATVGVASVGVADLIKLTQKIPYNYRALATTGVCLFAADRVITSHIREVAKEKEFKNSY